MIMKSVFGRLTRKPHQPAPKDIPAPRPHGIREERIVSEIADAQARDLLMRVRVDHVAIWTGQGLDVSGIVLSAREPEVLDMIRDRVFARVKHHAKAQVHEDGSIHAEPALTALIQGDRALSEARLAAVQDIDPHIVSLAQKAAEFLQREINETGEATFDPNGFSPQRSLPWPHQGWDREALVMASARFMDVLRKELSALGHEMKAVHGRIKFTKTDVQDVPSA